MINLLLVLLVMLFLGPLGLAVLLWFGIRMM